ncbi:VPA1269 family protein [Azonexus hydrophilus]|uniref:VPA1269 family protein n=1 Tax=Azonexus hydrophilus TaxID=418702 RepID=A0ABZ2XMG1_9RHOO
MPEQFIFGAEHCQSFENTLSGKTVVFNDDSDRFVLLHRPSKDEMQALLDRYVQQRIDDSWGTLGRLLEKDGRQCLAAFAKTESNRTVVLKADALLERFAGMYRNPGKGRHAEGIHAFLASLPLEEQQRLLASIKPKSVEEMRPMFVVSRFPGFFAFDPSKLTDGYESFEDFLEFLISNIRARREGDVYKGNKAAEFAARYQDILFMMVFEGWLLLPVRYGSFGVVSQYDRIFLSGCYLPAESNELIENAYRMLGASMRDSEGGKRSLRSFFFSSNIRQIEDISVEIVAHFERYVATKIPGSTGAKSGAYVVGDVLRTIFENKYPDRLFPAYRNFKEGESHLNKKSPTFKRVEKEFPEKPELKPWAELFAKFTEARESRTLTHVVYYLWRFVEYLASLDCIPATPAQIVRHVHIRDRSRENKSTYYDFLEKTGKSPKRNNSALHEIRRFFDWYLDYQVAAAEPVLLDVNPVRMDDGFGMPIYSLGMTHRMALPEFVLEAIKETIVADDFAFPRSRDIDYFETLDANGDPARVWFPGVSVCMYFLLDQPVRLKQARWLDDGLFDERVLLVEKTVTGEQEHWVHHEASNPLPSAVKGRRQGVIRAISDFGKLDTFTGLFINTNKTDEYDGFTPNGYEIPYVPPKTLELLLMMREWQRQWMPPLDSLVPYLDGEDLNDKYRDKVPSVSPMFRDPLSRSRRHPLSDHRLRRFYADVLKETEKRLKAKGYTLENGFDVQLVQQTEHATGKKYTSPVYDVHSLRVSGVTALLNRGVPIEIVSRYVTNHKTLTMCLWYFKPSAGQCRDVLLDAYASRRDEYAAINGDFAKSPELQSNWEAYSKHFLSNLRPSGESDAMHALDEGKGVWRIQPDGLCPGAECATGFLYKSDKDKGYYGSVPGGKTCSLCRYWITGPMFLLGQVIKMNSVMHAVEKKSSELRALKDVARAQEAERQWKELHASRARVHELEEELEIHVNDWHARLRFVTASMQQLDAYKETVAETPGSSKDLPVPWLSTNSPDGLNILLQETHSFALLDSVAQGVQFVPGMANTEAKLDHQKVLNSVLRKGGAKHLLLDLPDDIAFEAGNLLSSRLIQAATSNGVDLGKLLSGEVQLRDLTVMRHGQPVSLLEDMDMVLEAVANAKTLGVTVPLLTVKDLEVTD